ncbi:MAG: cation:proton antiporter [Henriciella sp.]|uniref:Na+/H+ antiporter subunit E n=1 Tax=Henriciella sp. TaxID=1968823 RepID=UPI000C0C7FC2|nr:Na+/H+ antiporter subunit E [Henriciella sp.]MAN74086.1 cation:proton antiporter [Henriciella sp.]MBF34212.1 cation:proton antiporter [Hyphomonadaceae bacterium]MBK76621.1 cation:proton antiporter [Henriciella sp.]PHR75611.1 MAG: cation:proton antiporter [Henriciella sp.]
MGYFLGLIFVLSALWLGLSGIYEPLLLTLGGISVVIAILLAARLETVDREGSPYGRTIPILAYWCWLLVEIFKANWPVIKACLGADLKINPALVKVKTRCESNLAKTIFANSITLTPGTVTVEVEGDMMLIHALFEEAATPESFEEMDLRSYRAADGKRKEELAA